MEKRIKYLFYILIIVMFSVTGFSMARYSSTFALNDSAKIGSFVLKENISSSILVQLNELEPGVSVDYTFDVSNYNEMGRTDVNINYVITVKSNYNVLPLSYELYKNNDMNNQLFNDGVSSVQTLNYSSDQVDSYTLRITLSEDAWEYQNQVDEIEVGIDAYQIN